MISSAFFSKVLSALARGYDKAYNCWEKRKLECNVFSLLKSSTIRMVGRSTLLLVMSSALAFDASEHHNVAYQVLTCVLIVISVNNCLRQIARGQK